MHYRNVLRATKIIVCILLLVSTSSAYTVVMRDGRRVEIPNNFFVDKATLTYEVSPGIQVTLQLAAINIPATERVNGEGQGVLLTHVNPTVTETSIRSVDTVPVKTTQHRSITNRDLESYRLAREASELTYERRRKELGLPTLEESKRKASLEAEQLEEGTRAVVVRQNRDEQYWRARASALRTELQSNDSRIHYVQRRLDEMPPAYGISSAVSLLPFAATSSLAFSNSSGFRTLQRRPTAIFTSPLINAQLAARTRGGPGPSQTVFQSGLRGNGRRPFVSPFASAVVVGLPFQTDDYLWGRSGLLNQLDELLSYRAELQARWRALEDEARRAGAYPGWLRD